MTPTFLKLEGSPACLIVPSMEHAELFLRLQNEEQSRQYLANYWPLSESIERSWLEKANKDRSDAIFTVAEFPSLNPIGSMGLHRIDWKNRRATTGSAIAEEYCNKGLGTAAKMLLLSWAFLELGLNKIESRVIANNGRSQAYSRKCGYKEVGRLRRHIFRDGKWHDEVILEVHAKEWLPLWKKFKADLKKKK